MIFKWGGEEYTGDPIPPGKKFKVGEQVRIGIEKMPPILRIPARGVGRVLAWDKSKMYMIGIPGGVALYHERELFPYVRPGR